jgi:hypothetical protein
VQTKEGMFMDEQMGGAAPEIQAPAPTEKMLSQSEVNSLIAREKQAAANRARQEVEREYQQRLEQMQHQQSQGGGQGDQRENTGPTQAEADSIYQQVQERFNREMQERQFQQEITNIANNYHAKIEHGKKSYEDFDKITENFDPGAFPQLIYLVSGIDNAADIIYDLSKNPNKLAAIDLLAQRSPKMAHAELMKLSGSISQNMQAKSDNENNPVSQPLSPLTPSRVSAGSNGPMSVSDLRNQKWLRG